MLSDYAKVVRTQVLDRLEPVELLHASFVTHRYSPHAHDEFAIGVIESGAVHTRIGHRAETVTAGSIVAFNPGLVHSGEPVDRLGYRYRMFYLSDSLLRCVTAQAENDGADECAIHFSSAVIQDPSLADRLTRAHALLEIGGDPLEGEETFVGALSDLVARHARRRDHDRSAKPHTAVVRIVRDYLEEEHARVVTLAELSELTGLSPFYLSRTFRAAIGVPPYAYLALVRVRRARALIAAGYSLSAVTHGTGFSDQSHFTKQFKRVMGITPGQYAREVARASGSGAAPVKLLGRLPRGATPRPRTWALPDRAAG